MRRAAVLGSPVGRSLSPALHRAAYAELGLRWSYEAVECDESALPALLDGLDDSWVGLSLTMPLKRAVLPLLDEVSELAAAVGAANTVVFEGERRFGDNTDVGGMLDALAGAGVRQAHSAVVLGAGATACSALAALRELGAADVVAAVRDTSRTAELRAAAERLGLAVRVRGLEELPGSLPADLVVSTLPAGAADRVAHLVAAGSGRPPGGSSGGSPQAVFDVCYEPWPTRLATVALAAGHPVVGGFDLLLHQAARQVALMTGMHTVPVAPMRTAGEWALAARRAGS